MFYSKGTSHIAVFDYMEILFINFENNIRLANVSYKNHTKKKICFQINACYSSINRTATNASVLYKQTFVTGQARVVTGIE